MVILHLTLFIPRVAQLCHLSFEELFWLIEDIFGLTNYMYVIYVWVFCDKLWQSFMCIFLFLLEEPSIKGPAVELK